MEKEMREGLLALARAYAAKKHCELSTIGQYAAGDWRFFTELVKGEKSVTGRKYDVVVRWFDSNWPDGLRWPGGIKRPSRDKARAAS